MTGRRADIEVYLHIFKLRSNNVGHLENSVTIGIVL
jgi:hypothetical protein